ncbi:MAG: hypothetical protein U1E62_21520 [Alsobacter sp.]
MSHPFDPLPPGDDRSGFDPAWPPPHVRDSGFEDDEGNPETVIAWALIPIGGLLLLAAIWSFL